MSLALHDEHKTHKESIVSWSKVPRPYSSNHWDSDVSGLVIENRDRELLPDN
jgi:hypothetical protein